MRVGISTCPNDTFAFHGILARKVPLRGLELDIELLDVQELNERLKQGKLDISKASFYAALHLSGTHCALPVGAALGFGVGPIVVAKDFQCDDWSSARVVCPGSMTTAALLMQAIHPEVPYIEHRVFSDIAPAVLRGEADLGVLIHEGRFTYQSQGLRLVEDLGASWERSTGLPLPLGGLLASINVSREKLSTFVHVVRDSLQYGLENREEALGTMQRYAQEFDATVLWKHVELYVNDYTMALGETGWKALQALEQRARDVGLVADDAPPLILFS